MLMRIICQVADHRIDRKRVWDDGYAFRTGCARCGLDLIRDHHGWRPFDPVSDDDKARKPHPRHTRR